MNGITINVSESQLKKIFGKKLEMIPPTYLWVGIFITMKIIITEAQNNRWWLLRRYKLVENSFEEAFNIINPCKFKSFDDYERRFVHLMIEDLHPEYYLIDNFDYEGTKSELKDMFYVELTEMYYERKC